MWGDVKKIIPYVWEVVELSNHVMPVVWTRETVFALDLWAEVSENQHCWVILAYEQRSNENFEAF